MFILVWICPAYFTVFVVSLLFLDLETIHHPLCHFGSSIALRELPFVSLHPYESELENQPASQFWCHLLPLPLSFSSVPLLRCPFCEQSMGTTNPSLARRLFKPEFARSLPAQGGLSKQEGGPRGRPVQLASTESYYSFVPLSFSWFAAAAYLVI